MSSYENLESNKVMRRFLVTVCIVTLTFLVGCSDPNQDPYAGWKASDIYQEGHERLTHEDFSTSIKAFESLQAQYPFGTYTEQGDLELVYAYYRHDTPDLAVTSAERFIRLYPNSKHLDYAYYMLGIVYYANGRTLFQRYLPYTLSNHDPSDLLQSYSILKTLVEKFPNTSYKNDAVRRLLFLRNTIAKHEIQSAEFYLDKKAYVAVINHAQTILLHYPNTPEQERALELLYTSYTALHSTKLADNIQQIIALNFPNNSLAHVEKPDPAPSKLAHGETRSHEQINNPETP